MTAGHRADAVWPSLGAIAGCHRRLDSLLGVTVGANRSLARDAIDGLLVVLGPYIEALEFIEVLLGDEPVLELEQRFYQRRDAGLAVRNETCRLVKPRPRPPNAPSQLRPIDVTPCACRVAPLLRPMERELSHGVV